MPSLFALRRFVPLAFACAAACTALAPTGASAQSKSKRHPTDQVRVEYVAPKNAEHQSIHERMKAIGLLEQVRTFMAPFRLPRRLMLKTAGCDGVANAYYEDGTVLVCYEYIAEVLKNAPTETTPHGVTPEAAVTGPIVEVFLHELAHALFEILEVPVLGREEDAADLIAAYILLQMAPDDARRLIGGIAYMYAQEAKTKNPTLQDFADEHGLPAQRLFNLLCMAYGAQPKTFADLIEKDILPKKRAEGCEGEYSDLEFAAERLIAPHMHLGMRERTRKEIRSGKWLKPMTPTVSSPSKATGN